MNKPSTTTFSKQSRSRMANGSLFLGDVDGRTAGARRWRDAYASLTESLSGESFIDLMARVSGTIDRLLADHGGRDIVVVAHGGSIRAAIAHALGLSPEKALGFVIENCSLTRLDHIGGASGSHPGADQDAWRVGGINHLPDDSE